VRDRENLRFERTRLFGRVRRIFLEIGKRFYADNLLEDPRDIFFLEQAEIFGFVEGTSTCTDLKGLVAVRQAEFARFKEGEAPDERFATRGVAYQNSFRTPRETVQVEGEPQHSKKGIGCFPGVIRGKVRVIRDPREAELESGSILVAERTDPGWIMLFPAAKGLLVERGSLLSHSAIVAREMGIPAIVSIPGLMNWLSDGDFVEFDGSTGIVRKLCEAVPCG
jgi:pyruvate,water dikinase